MTKFIIRFMHLIIEFLAWAIVLGSGLVAVGMALDEDPWLILFYLPLGVLLGLFVAAIVIGIPLLVLRINQNLDEINSKLKS